MPIAELVNKYNIPVPRYTSYPTVPFWKEEMTNQLDWKQQIEKAIRENKLEDGLSLYLHLPFCEQLCTYCGCNKRITKNHRVEEVYIAALLKEWGMYKSIFGKKLSVRELHLGGGTPTFFAPENLQRLLTELLKDVKIDSQNEFGFEGHPNNTSQQHLQTLYDIGFRRVSFGVQDLDHKVQVAINRIQPFEKLKQVTDWARSIGYTSVNYDLIYGLPFQTKTSMRQTIEKVLELKPDRIAFYSYAHVPWSKKSQRAYDEHDLPKGNDKYELYELGKELFKEAGYEDVGMDHFALAGDSLLQSKQDGTLHRNFMGYTTNNTKVLIGLGVSAISDSYFGYRQNYKTLEEYYAAMDKEVLPIYRGIDLDDEDIRNRARILEIACKGKTSWEDGLELTDTMIARLDDMQDDGLITWNTAGLEVTPLGWNFLRNICAVFDKRMNDAAVSEGQMFSQAV